MALGMDMQGPNVFVKHADVQHEGFFNGFQRVGGTALEHFVVDPLARFATTARAVLHITQRHP